MSNVAGIWSVLAVAGLVVGVVSGPATAAEHGKDVHRHSAQTGKLVLNQGYKWATDEPLRKAMEAMRGQMVAALHAIHTGKLSTAEYTTLANGLGAEVGTIVAQCKLEPKADAQLHVVIAGLLAGTDAMQGKVRKTTRQQGAIQVLEALENYATYFDHPNWQPIKE